MKRKLFLILCCVLMMLMASCVPTQMVITEGDQVIAQVHGAQFVVPDGYRVVGSDAMLRVAKTFTADKVILLKTGRISDKVIVFAGQKADAGRGFAMADLNRKFPDAFFFDKHLGYISHTATYLANMPMSRRVYLEYPLCKVLTGFSYKGKKVRYRIDVYENFKQNPEITCCSEQPKTKKDLKGLEAMNALKEELDQFRKDSLALIKDHVRWPSGTM